MSKGQRRGNYIEAEEVGLNASVRKEVSITYQYFFHRRSRFEFLSGIIFPNLCRTTRCEYARAPARSKTARLGKKDGLFMNVLHD